VGYLFFAAALLIQTTFMATLLDDIKTQSEWIVKAFAADSLKLDYTIRSFIAIDKFFNENTKDGNPLKGGRLTKNHGSIIFSIGSYVGQTIIKTIPGSMWVTDDNDPQGEITASVKLPDASTIWPIQRIIKRFQNGSEDSVYVYGHHFIKDFIDEPIDQSYWDINKEESKAKKSWWKFW